MISHFHSNHRHAFLFVLGLDEMVFEGNAENVLDIIVAIAFVTNDVVVI